MSKNTIMNKEDNLKQYSETTALSEAEILKEIRMHIKQKRSFQLRPVGLLLFSPPIIRGIMSASLKTVF